MNPTPTIAPELHQRQAARTPWILAASPAALGLIATVAVALASALAMIQPGAAQAQVSTAIVTAVAGA